MTHANNRRLLTLTASVAAVFAVAACGDRTDRTTADKTTAPSTAYPPANTAAPSPSDSAVSTAASTAPAATSGPSVTPGGPIATTDREFVALAASSDTLEIESGRLALEKSKNLSVRAFAQHMLDDRSKTSANLKQIASAVGATPPTSIAPPHQAHLDKLRALDGAEFDREYGAQIGVAAHQEAVALFERASREAANADIRSFVENTLPELRKHLEDGQTLAKNLGVSSDRLKAANAPPDLSRLSAMVQSGLSSQGSSTK